MATISDELDNLVWMPARCEDVTTVQRTAAQASITINALVAALERLTRVARVELAASRPDVIEQADAALALARGGK